MVSEMWTELGEEDKSSRAREEVDVDGGMNE